MNAVQSEVAPFPSVSTFFTTMHKPYYHTQCVTAKIIPDQSLCGSEWNSNFSAVNIETSNLVNEGRKQ